MPAFTWTTVLLQVRTDAAVRALKPPLELVCPCSSVWYSGPVCSTKGVDAFTP